MSRDVTLEERAISQAAGFLQDDPAGLRSAFEAIDRLGEDPYPEGSSPFARRACASSASGDTGSCTP